jgi:hypothetical protein
MVASRPNCTQKRVGLDAMKRREIFDDSQNPILNPHQRHFSVEETHPHTNMFLMRLKKPEGFVLKKLDSENFIKSSHSSQKAQSEEKV